MKKTLLVLALSLITFTSCKEDTVEKKQEIKEDNTENELLIGNWKLTKEGDNELSECNSKTNVTFKKTEFVSNKYSVNNEKVCSLEKKTYSYIIEGKYIVTVDDKKAPIVIDGIIQKFGFSIEEGELKTLTEFGVSVFKKI